MTRTEPACRVGIVEDGDGDGDGRVPLRIGCFDAVLAASVAAAREGRSGVLLVRHAHRDAFAAGMTPKARDKLQLNAAGVAWARACGARLAAVLPPESAPGPPRPGGDAALPSSCRVTLLSSPAPRCVQTTALLCPAHPIERAGAIIVAPSRRSEDYRRFVHAQDTWGYAAGVEAWLRGEIPGMDVSIAERVHKTLTYLLGRLEGPGDERGGRGGRIDGGKGARHAPPPHVIIACAHDLSVLAICEALTSRGRGDQDVPFLGGLYLSESCMQRSIAHLASIVGAAAGPEGPATCE